MYCKMLMRGMLHKMVIFKYGWYHRVVAVIICCSIRLLLISSRRLLTIVNCWRYTVVYILEERLFGVHAGKVLEDCNAFICSALFFRKVDTTSWDSEWVSQFSVLNCQWQSTFELRWFPSLIPYQNIRLKWFSESGLSLEMKKSSHRYVWM
jgi:hypothetical protein